ncbi:hypothetical protein ZOSMA_162G00380 [Zostera marina]|uniref:Uncharacterized protein n=1 Tax=Zostera marina TaxID=29655 RepID=A0A0K9PW83_ZOSMR|nr:hypothetical protein ZOSMA_162G00380 [Zostera marina]
MAGSFKAIAADGCAGNREWHVLAVDDSIVDRKLIERLLKLSSYRVTTVDSGKRALELLELAVNSSTTSAEPKVNMIITDYCMPEMTGYDLLKRVKESSLLKEIPVVVVSSENVPNRITRCLEEGAQEFLLKPLRQSDVSRLCSSIENQSRGLMMNMIGRQTMIIFLVIAFFTFVAKVSAKNHSVGGHPGWDINFNMSAWLTGRLFQTGDNLVFQYGSEYNVLETDEKAYNSCTVDHWIESHSGGYTLVPLTSAGTRYFLCGSVPFCKRGMKLQVVVVNNDNEKEHRQTPQQNAPSPQVPKPSPVVPPVPEHHKVHEAPPAPYSSGVCLANNIDIWGGIIVLGTLFLIHLFPVLHSLHLFSF